MCSGVTLGIRFNGELYAQRCHKLIHLHSFNRFDKYLINLIYVLHGDNRNNEDVIFSKPLIIEKYLPPLSSALPPNS